MKSSDCGNCGLLKFGVLGDLEVTADKGWDGLRLQPGLNDRPIDLGYGSSVVNRKSSLHKAVELGMAIAQCIAKVFWDVSRQAIAHLKDHLEASESMGEFCDSR